MPPANSPVGAATPADRQQAADSSTSFSAMISGLSSPVPNFASTLNYCPDDDDDDVDNDNIDFLRNYSLYYQDEAGPPDSEEHASEATRNTNSAQRPYQSEHQGSSQYLSPADHRASTYRQPWPAGRLARHVATSSSHPSRQALQGSDASDPQPGATTASPYGERVPHQQSLYDWAPATEDAGEHELEYILSELRRSQPNTHPDVLRSLAMNDLLEASRGNLRFRSSLQRTPSSQQDSSLREAAILQSVRRHLRINQQTRTLMNMLNSERERTSQSGTPSSRTPSYNGSMSALDASTPSSTTTLQLPSTSNTVERYRYHTTRAHAPSSFSTSTTEAPPNEQQYIVNRPRASATQQDLANRERRQRSFFSGADEQLAPFVKAIELWYSRYSFRKASAETGDLHYNDPIPLSDVRPPYVSWLAPGVTFTGEQQALQSSPTGDSSSTHSASANSVTRRPNLPNRWPVKLAIHAVDYKSMTLQGTMEAFNVYAPSIPDPSRPSNTDLDGTKTTFSTYVEGEIIDFANHPLQTDSANFGVKTSASVDAEYWSRLEPFVSVTPHQLGDVLASPQWIRENVTQKYVLMRWKERSFVKPTFTSFSSMGVSYMQRSTGLYDAQRLAPRYTTEELTHRPVPPPPTETFLSSADGNGFGLSISGYYYVSLRRSDGHCEGLYYDPTSAPFQRLDLAPTVGTWGCGSWEFR